MLKLCVYMYKQKCGKIKINICKEIQKNILLFNFWNYNANCMINYFKYSLSIIYHQTYLIKGMPGWLSQFSICLQLRS